MALFAFAQPSPSRENAPKPVKGRWFMMWIDDGQIVGYEPDKDEVYLVLVGRNGASLERAACLNGVAELAPSSP